MRDKNDDVLWMTVAADFLMPEERLKQKIHNKRRSQAILKIYNRIVFLKTTEKVSFYNI